MLISLRDDYGATWNGDINMKNVKLYAFTERPIHLISNSYRNWYYGYDVSYPNVSIDNIEFYDVETFLPLPRDYEILLNKENFAREPHAHCKQTLFSPPYYADVDDDGDGLVDGTDIPYDDVVERDGVLDTESRLNLNPVTPPTVIKITSHNGASVDGKCKITVFDTCHMDGVKDGGFFGKTSFITDGNTYIGTDFIDKETETFKFVKYIQSEE